MSAQGERNFAFFLNTKQLCLLLNHLDRLNKCQKKKILLFNLFFKYFPLTIVVRIVELNAKDATFKLTIRLVRSLLIIA